MLVSARFNLPRHGAAFMLPTMPFSFLLRGAKFLQQSARLSFLLGFLAMGRIATIEAQEAQGQPAASPPDLSISAAAILRGETEEARLQWLRRRMFVTSVLAQTSQELTDSTMAIRFALAAGALALKPEELAGIPPAYDPIGARMKEKELGIPPLLNVGNLIGEGLKYLTGKIGAGPQPQDLWTVIPSETEARVMNALWSRRTATASEIYAQLDSMALTFKDLQIVLDNMVARGLVEREQISPKNELTILGAFTIETSRKNARNREYLYRPRANRKTFYTFLDALAFSSGTPGNHSALRDHLHRLLAIIAPRELQD